MSYVDPASVGGLPVTGGVISAPQTADEIVDIELQQATLSSILATSLPVLNAVADNGVTNNGNSASLMAQMATLMAAGRTAARLPSALNAYGLEKTLVIPPGFWLFGDGPLSFRSPKTGTQLTSGNYTGTAFVPCVGWVDPGFDIRQDGINGSTVSFSSASTTISDTAIQASDAGRPVTGYNLSASINNTPVYVGTVTVGTSFVLVNASGTPVAPIGTGTVLCVGTNYPISNVTGSAVGGLVCLGSNSSAYGSGNAIVGCTINATNVNNTTKATVALYTAGSGVTVKECLILDGLVSGIHTAAGTGTGSSEDSTFFDIAINNTQQNPVITLTNSGNAITGTTGSPILSSITTSLSPVASYPQALSGAANPLGAGAPYNGAMVIGTGIPAGTFIAQGGINANGTGTLLLSKNVTSAFTGLDVTIIQPDMVGVAARFASTDCYIHNLRVSIGEVAAVGGDLVFTGGNIFGSPAAALPLSSGATATWAGCPDVYVYGTGGTDEGAVQFSGVTFGPGPGKGITSFIRRDSGMVTGAACLFEINGTTNPNALFEDNDANVNYGGFNVHGTLKGAKTTSGIGLVCYRRDGNNNPRSTFMIVMQNLAYTGANLWGGGNLGPISALASGGIPGIALINNSGTITTVQPSTTQISNLLARPTSERVNPLDAAYGAQGDGVTDDTNAIQAALYAAAGGTCEFSFTGSSYMVRGNLVIPNNTRVTAVGKWGTEGSGPKVLTLLPNMATAGTTVLMASPQYYATALHSQSIAVTGISGNTGTITSSQASNLTGYGTVTVTGNGLSGTVTATITSAGAVTLSGGTIGWSNGHNYTFTTSAVAGTSDMVIVDHMSFDLNQGANNSGIHGLFVVGYRSHVSFNYFQNVSPSASGIVLGDFNVAGNGMYGPQEENVIENNWVIFPSNSAQVTGTGQGHGIWVPQTQYLGGGATAGTSDSYVHRNIVFNAPGDALRFDSTGDMVITHNHPYFITGQCAIHLGYLNNTRIENNNFENFGANPINGNTYYGILFNGVSGSTASSGVPSSITNNTIHCTEADNGPTTANFVYISGTGPSSGNGVLGISNNRYSQDNAGTSGTSQAYGIAGGGSSGILTLTISGDVYKQGSVSGTVMSTALPVSSATLVVLGYDPIGTAAGLLGSLTAANTIRPTTGVPTSLITDIAGDYAIDTVSQVLYGPFIGSGVSGTWPNGIYFGNPLTHFGYLGVSNDPAVSSQTVAMTNNVTFLARITALTTGSVGHIGYRIATAGSGFTANDSFVGLYDTGQASSGNLTQLGVSTTQATIWTSSAVYGTTLTTAANIIAGQDYYVAWLATASTPPFLAAAGSSFITDINLTTANMRFGTYASGATLPATIPISSLASLNSAPIGVLLP